MKYLAHSVALVVLCFIIVSSTSFAHAQEYQEYDLDDLNNAYFFDHFEGAPYAESTDVKERPQYSGFFDAPGLGFRNTLVAAVHDAVEVLARYLREVSGLHIDRSSRPNILFILLDDAGYESFSSYGSDYVSTPNIDRVAREGVRFTQFYTNSPVCSPTRVGLLSGQHPARFGIVKALPNVIGGCVPLRKTITDDVPLLPQVLKNNGYATGHVGKWHVGKAKPTGRGYDESYIFDETDYIDVPFLVNDSTRVQTTGFLTERHTDYAIDFIEEHKDEPFFLNLWYYAPHKPLGEAPIRWLSQYPDTERGKYAALIAFVDEQIGRVVDSLESQGILDDTIVVVTSDNGGYKVDGEFSTNGDLRSGKQHVFEGGIRVPMVIRWPGYVAANTFNDSVTVGFDFFPTLAELLEIDVSHLELDGISFANTLISRDKELRDGILVWEHKNQIHGRDAVTYAVRSGKWKIVKYGKFIHLFDITQDKSESNNLADEYPEVVKRLRDAYTDWRFNVGETKYAFGRHVGDITSGPRNLRFNGDGGRITIKKNSVLDTSTDDLTVSMWIKPEQRVSRRGVIASKGASWRLWFYPNKTVQLDLVHKEKSNRDDKYETVLRSTTPLEIDEWHHIAFTTFNNFVGESKTILYVDGIPNVEDSTAPYVAPSDFLLYFGNDILLKKPFYGSIGDLRFFHTKLTEDEIQILMEADRPL